MEDMDADLLVEIPDTPDRIRGKGVNAGLISRHFRSHDLRDGVHLESQRSKCRLVTENGQNKKVHMHPQRNSGNHVQMECSDNVIVLSPSKSSHPSQDASLFRRSALDRDSKHEGKSSKEQCIKHATQSSARLHQKDKGKAICSEDDSILDLTKLNEHEMLDLAFPRCVPHGVPSEQQKEKHVPLNCGSDLYAGRRPSVSPSNICKAKGKIGENRYEGLGLPIRITSDLSQKVEKQSSSSHISTTPPRVVARKRLVRNGYISPQNIEIKSKQVSENKPNSSRDVQQSNHRDVISKDSYSMLKDIREIVTNVASSGQREINHPNIASQSVLNPVGISSSPQVNKEDGWRSTRNRPHSLAPCGTMTHNASQTASASVSDLNSRNMLRKRQKRHDSGLRNHGESSVLVPDDSNVIVLGSPGETFSSRSYRSRNNRETGTGPSQVRQTEINSASGLNNDNSGATARQLEADERLARELQEQIYHEALIQEDDVQEGASHTSFQAHHPPNPRNPRRRQPRLRPVQNPLTRRRNQSRTTTRMSQLRSEVLGRSTAAFPWASSSRFPPGMDLEMRLNILEALENAIGDLDDSGLSSHMLQLQHEFNEQTGE